MTATAQNMQALAYANEVRLGGLRYLREIAAGKRKAANLIVSPPPYADRLTVVRVLRAQPRWGDQRAQKLCNRLHVNPLRRLGELTERQRAELAFVLRNPRAYG